MTSPHEYPDGYATAPHWVIRNPDFPPMAKLLYVYLESRANKEGIAWPGQALIAQELGVSVATVERAVKWMKENDLIEVEARATKVGRANTYRMTGVLPLSLTGWGSPHDEGGSPLTEGMGPLSQRAEEEPLEEEPMKKNHLSSTSLSVTSASDSRKTSPSVNESLVELKTERRGFEGSAAKGPVEDLEAIKVALSKRAQTPSPIPLSREMNPLQLGYTVALFEQDFPGLKYTDVLELFRTHYISKGDKSNNWFEKFLMFSDGAQRRRKENIRSSGGTETDSMGLPIDPEKRRGTDDRPYPTHGSTFLARCLELEAEGHSPREADAIAIAEFEKEQP